MRSLNKQKIIYGVLLAVWMTFIFVMSAQPAQQSSQLSGGLVSKIVAVIYPNFSSLLSAEQSSITHTVTFIVRKAAHFSEYFILGVLGFFVANTYQKYKFSLRALSATLFCVLYAASDEIHQFFVPGRACRFLDICIDAAGSVAAIVLLAVILYRKKISNRSGESDAQKKVN